MKKENISTSTYKSKFDLKSTFQEALNKMFFWKLLTDKAQNRSLQHATIFNAYQPIYFKSIIT